MNSLDEARKIINAAAQKAVDDTGKTMIGKLLQDVKVLAVLDASGRDVFENTAENTKQIISYEQGLKNSELDEKIDNAQRELKDQIQNNNYAINSKIDEQMAEEKRNFEYQLSEIKKQLESVIYEQKNYYENQINLLKDRIAELEWQNEDLLDRVEELEAEVDELQVFMWDIQDGPYVGY